VRRIQVVRRIPVKYVSSALERATFSSFTQAIYYPFLKSRVSDNEASVCGVKDLTDLNADFPVTKPYIQLSTNYKQRRFIRTAGKPCSILRGNGEHHHVDLPPPPRSPASGVVVPYPNAQPAHFEVSLAT